MQNCNSYEKKDVFTIFESRLGFLQFVDQINIEVKNIACLKKFAFLLNYELLLVS